MLRSVVVLAVLGVGASVLIEGRRAAESTSERPPRMIIVKTTDLSPTQYRFRPTDITVQRGDTVRWVQTTNTPHNVEFKQVPAASDLGSQRVGPYLVSPGQTYEIVVDARFARGVHHYVCTPHESMGMVGTITVGPDR